MQTITSVKHQKNKRRVNIYLDGKFGFGLDLENFVKLKLKIEQQLSEDDIKKIVKEAEFAKTYEKLLKFAMLRPRSVKEVIDWLHRKKVHESIHNRLFDKLNHLDLIGDEKFSKWWIGQRLQFKNKSRRELIQELRTKGISGEIIGEVLSESGLDEVKSARKLIAKNKYKWEHLPPVEAKRKKSEYLARKGFVWDTVKQAVDYDEDEL
jgi:regulatory protein